MTVSKTYAMLKYGVNDCSTTYYNQFTDEQLTAIANKMGIVLRGHDGLRSDLIRRIRYYSIGPSGRAEVNAIIESL